LFLELFEFELKPCSENVASRKKFHIRYRLRVAGLVEHFPSPFVLKQSSREARHGIPQDVAQRRRRTPMRWLASYVVAGILVVLAMDFFAPPFGLGLPVGAWPAAAQDSLVQSVVRTNKGDRLMVPKTIGKQQAPRKSPTMLVGCDPVFSPLSASASANFPGRCIV
jgi:hypothetical protein